MCIFVQGCKHMEPDQDQAAQLRRDAYALAAETGCDARTAKKWPRGERVAAVTDSALSGAAERLGITRGASDGA